MNRKKSLRRAASLKYSHAFMHLLRATLLSFLVALGGLFLFRIILLCVQGQDLLTSEWRTDLLAMVWMGLRFDAKMLSTCFLLPLLLFPFAYLFSKRTMAQGWVRRLWVVIETILFVGLWLICVVDYYYFSFFHSHFDATAWGLIDDDTTAVLKSIRSDFPVLRVFLLTLVVATGAALWGSYWMRSPYRAKSPSRFLVRIGLTLGCLAGLFLLARGTLDTHPLRAIHLNVSRQALINQLTNSPLFALYDVLAHAQEYKLELDTEVILRRWGFHSETEAVKAYCGTADSAATAPSASLFAPCVELTPCRDSLRRHSPHVVFLQMESMGSYFLQFQQDPFNLLGTLREELPYGYCFTHTLSGGSGTLASLEELLFGIVQGPVAQSSHFRTPLPYSVAKVFAQQGYTTRYVSGQRLGWRNVKNFLTAQEFDYVEGERELRDYVAPTTAEGTWGLHDEALFERILQLLRTAEQPQFIYGMSLSHHTPYDTPQTEHTRGLHIPDSLWRLIDMPEEVARKSFAALAYQNDQLGRFLKAVRESELGERTIIAFTGDHTLKQNLKHCDDPLKLYGVPIVFFVPKQLLGGRETDTEQYASHNDIFPTLFHLALSGARYFRTGRNLFDLTSPHPRVALYDRKLLLAPGYTVALNATNKPMADATTSPAVYDSLYRFGRAYHAVMECFVAHELHKDPAFDSLFTPVTCPSIDSVALPNGGISTTAEDAHRP